MRTGVGGSVSRIAHNRVVAMITPRTIVREARVSFPSRFLLWHAIVKLVSSSSSSSIVVIVAYARDYATWDSRGDGRARDRSYLVFLGIARPQITMCINIYTSVTDTVFTRRVPDHRLRRYVDVVT